MGGAMLSLPQVGSQTQYLQKVAMVKRRADRQSFSESGTCNFTDLAQMVCKVRSNYGVNSDEDDSYEEDDEDYGPGGYASEHSLDFASNTTGQKVNFENRNIKFHGKYYLFNSHCLICLP